MIIGLTGQNGSGKGAVADILKKEFKYDYLSLSDAIRLEAKKRRIKITRKRLQDVGNELRENHGPDVLAAKILEQVKDRKNYVIDSIRNLAEARLLQENGVCLFRIQAPPGIRFERLKKRKREGEPITYEKFLESEDIENHGGETGQQLNDVGKLAKIVIVNDSTPDALKKKVRKAMDDIIAKQQAEETYLRPSWDEYFMEIMRQVGTRGTCNRGRSGCVITRNNQILVSGYVGSPIGLAHCDEIGHEFKKTIHEDGHVSQHCVRTAHAEQNAICQAAKLGISLEGAMIYTRMTPCYVCAKMLINCGIRRVVAANDYHGATESKRIFKESGVKLEILDAEVVKYKNM